ncbi:MAG: insulinase family protein [Calditerrivibrio sp.]|nr:insulinase family protein [Calditerrivibrio sp.]MCA1980046.1 insulinase family protein [Calditerrivibrio sp.]
MFAAEEFRLDNGIKVVYNRIPNIKITSVQVWMDTGSRNETKEINGISHFLEHMVFKGTEKFGPDEIDLLVEANGGQMNAATSKDYTFYYITIPTENVEIAFDAISQMVFDAKFIEEEIEKEKPVVLEEIKRKYDDPTYDMWTYLSDTFYQGTSYSMEIIGTDKNVKSFTRKQLIDYYNKYYHPHNMTLVVVGDIERKDVESFAIKYFGKKRLVEHGDQIVFSQPDLKDNVDKIFKKDVNQVYSVIAYKAPKINEKDIYTLDVLDEILSGGEFSLLNNELKNEKGLVNSISGGYSGLKYGGVFIVFYTSEYGKEYEVDKEVYRILSNIASGNIEDSLIESAKNRLKSMTIFKREKASSEAEDIGFSYTLGLQNYYKNFMENVDKIGKDDLAKMMQDILKGNSVVIRTVPN